MNKKTVQEFEYNIEQNIFDISKSLQTKTYKMLNYKEFCVYDPKKRYIHAAEVRDRVVHQALFQVLNTIYDKTFIYDSYSCRINKGTHAGLKRLEYFTRKESKNYTQPVYVLKCDIAKFFDSIDHNILRNIINRKIKCTDTLNLINIIINSFTKSHNKGLPLGNVTSQFMGNLYMNEFDFFVKQKLCVKYYIRYCDDFVIVSKDKNYLENVLVEVKTFLEKNLLLKIHPRKQEIRTLSKGIDFLGYVLLPYYKVLRTNTKKRIIRKVKNGLNKNQIESYKGVLKHAKTYTLSRELFPEI